MGGIEPTEGFPAGLIIYTGFWEIYRVGERDPQIGKATLTLCRFTSLINITNGYHANGWTNAVEETG